MLEKVCKPGNTRLNFVPGPDPGDDMECGQARRVKRHSNHVKAIVQLGAGRWGMAVFFQRLVGSAMPALLAAKSMSPITKVSMIVFMLNGPLSDWSSTWVSTTV